MKKDEKENKIVKDYTEQMQQTEEVSTASGSYSGKYKARQLLTRNEWIAYQTLEEIAKANELVICPKVRLIDIIEPKRGEGEAALRAKVIQKHVDFVICKSNLQILGVVELDDSSHDTAKRIERDKFVDEILTDVGYTVIHTRYINRDTLDPILRK